MSLTEHRQTPAETQVWTLRWEEGRRAKRIYAGHSGELLAIADDNYDLTCRVSFHGDHEQVWFVKTEKATGRETARFNARFFECVEWQKEP